jgi:hypothetical protein
VKHIFRVGEIVFILAITVAYPCATSSLLLWKHLLFPYSRVKLLLNLKL